jgi:hypothetical protein
MRTQKGLLLTCDVGVKEYLVWLERSGAIATFILKEVDDHHLFVASRPRLFEELQEYLDAWHGQRERRNAQRDMRCGARGNAWSLHVAHT